MSELSESRSSTELSLKEILCDHTCPACGHHVAVPFYDGGKQPLTTLAWPKSREEAMAMPRLPLSFVRCVECGHVYNHEFDYAAVPYSDKPNLMFNKGSIWSEHLRAVRDLILENLPEKPTVVEIGCGEGHLLRALADARPEGRYIGFDPNATIDTEGEKITARAELFDPTVHLAEYRPDFLISRHVLEHLMNPLGFVQALAFAASWENLETRLLIEVPCVDHVFAMGRTVDFFYEHNSHFTTQSLERMLKRCASSVELIRTSYNGEVVFGIAEFQQQTEKNAHARGALDFQERVNESAEVLRKQLDELHTGGRRVAIWGGTGKAAAFINQMDLDCERFPLVVDSDSDKAGTFVPGTGQKILFRDALLVNPAEVILIATQWRAADIAQEIERCGIQYENILLEYQGKLVDFFAGEHPYHLDSAIDDGASRHPNVPCPKSISAFQNQEIDSDKQDESETHIFF